jgi:electron transfer flavoprotein alpha subunit
MSVLVIAELRQGVLRSPTFPAISAGKALAAVLGSSFDILVLGQSAKGAAESLAGHGAATVYYNEAPALADYTAEAHASAAASLVREKGYKAALTAATSTGKDLMPRLAGLLGAGMVSDVIGFEAGVYLRPMYAGNAIARLASDTPVTVLTARETAFDPSQPGGSSSAVSEAAVPAEAGGAKFVGFQLTQSARPSLTEAAVVVSAGRGMKDAAGVQLVEQLADALNAALGASRAVVDEGLLPNDLQVGQTGKIVAPDLYIACGISGAIQHVAGMKDSKVIVAINKDEEAPIFEVADYGLVADAMKAIPELVAKIKAVRG